MNRKLGLTGHCSCLLPLLTGDWGPRIGGDRAVDLFEKIVGTRWSQRPDGFWTVGMGARCGPATAHLAWVCMCSFSAISCHSYLN